MIKNANAYVCMDQRIDRIRVSEADRQIAREHLRDADFVADLICRAVGKVRAADGLGGRFLAHRAI